MNQEEFENECRKPVDLEECHKALQRLIDRGHTLHIPARPNDEDMLMSRAIRELKEFRMGDTRKQAALQVIKEVWSGIGNDMDINPSAKKVYLSKLEFALKNL